ncbi:hypothetical protein SEA_WOFFORD_253 [Streptomyces phage Wofford]|uniref:NADAR domain-containing protein n=1 Tax=Streptomyces phage Wofford TaxID=2283267 RepID=A0A345MA66_9CAUD|nr:NADAR family protein [Streptomyces phage Wollford]AXH67387.1 hypothetical protein SEA_WOFFORD_253 [Streptomyces phage Wollford]
MGPRVNPIIQFVGEHYYLSNFYTAPVKLGNLTFKTNEAAFQASKYKAMIGTQQEQYAFIAAILDCDTPGETKKLGKNVSIDLDKWEQIKVRCMRDVVKAKFDQNDDLRIKLIETGAALLVEGNDWGDKFWGRCDGKGLNILGSILMELRGYYFWKEYQSIW